MTNKDFELLKTWVVLDEQDDIIVDSFDSINDAAKLILRYPSIMYIVHKELIAHHNHIERHLTV